MVLLWVLVWTYKYRSEEWVLLRVLVQTWYRSEELVHAPCSGPNLIPENLRLLKQILPYSRILPLIPQTWNPPLGFSGPNLPAAQNTIGQPAPRGGGRRWGKGEIDGEGGDCSILSTHRIQDCEFKVSGFIMICLVSQLCRATEIIKNLLYYCSFFFFNIFSWTKLNLNLLWIDHPHFPSISPHFSDI